jgi:hypothetical protein
METIMKLISSLTERGMTVQRAFQNMLKSDEVVNDKYRRRGKCANVVEKNDVNRFSITHPRRLTGPTQVMAVAINHQEETD